MRPLEVAKTGYMYGGAKKAADVSQKERVVLGG